jgi:hypothetical protein
MAGGYLGSARPGANRGNAEDVVHAHPSAVQQLNDVTVAADVVQRRHAVGQLANAAIAVVLRDGAKGPLGRLNPEHAPGWDPPRAAVRHGFPARGRQRLPRPVAARRK